jgi:hypothetical protein
MTVGTCLAPIGQISSFGACLNLETNRLVA